MSLRTIGRFARLTAALLGAALPLAGASASADCTPARNTDAVRCVQPANDTRKQMAAVTDNRAEQEFELTVDGVTAIAAYQLEGDTIVFTHTQVPRQMEGHGIGSRLIRGALDQVRDRGLRVVPQCPFVADFIQRHPEYRDLLR